MEEDVLEAPRGKEPKRSCMLLAWRLASDGILVHGLELRSCYCIPDDAAHQQILGGLFVILNTTTSYYVCHAISA